MMSLQSQPLSIDYLSLIGEETETTDSHASFWQSLLFHIRAFLGSFYCDYTVLDTADTAAGETIKVWFSGGREQAELLKGIIDEDFTRHSGINVQLQLVSVSLAQSILAGTFPDVTLSNSRYQAINLGVRGVLEDLTGYEGFAEYPAAWGEEIFKPYSQNGATWALPVTLDYFTAFYRTDIFEELGLTVPKTWDEFDHMVTILQRNNLTAGLPYTMLSSAATIEAGIGTKDIFATMLLQRDVELYSEDGTKILLDQPVVTDVFRKWTEFYDSQQLDLQFSFDNRFRTGEMPYAIAGYGSYNLLSSTAPEIKGLWEMAQIPGTPDENGQINCATAASGSGVVLMSNSQKKEEAWKFIRWWVSAEAQGRYGNELEQLMGKASRYNPANPEAVELLPWGTQEREMLLKVRETVRELPEVLGGYYVSRGIDNAFRNVLYANANYKEALLTQNNRINAELERKQREIAHLK